MDESDSQDGNQKVPPNYNYMTGRVDHSINANQEKRPKEEESFWQFYAGLWRESPFGAFVVTVVALYALYVVYCCFTSPGGAGGGRYDPDEGQQIYWPH